MYRSLLHRLPNRHSWKSFAPILGVFSQGMVCGVLLLSIFLAWSMNWGTSLPVQTVWAFCLFLALFVGGATQKSSSTRLTDSPWFVLPTLGIFLCLLPLFTSVTRLWISEFSLEFLTSEWRLFLLLLPVGMLLITFPTTGVVRLAFQSGKPDAGFLSGMAGGMLVVSLFTGPIWGMEFTGYFTAGILFLTLCGILIHRRFFLQPLETGNSVHSVAVEQTNAAGFSFVQLLAAFAAGILLASTWRMLNQLLPATALQMALNCAGILSGISCAVALLQRWPVMKQHSLLVGYLACAVGTLLLIVGFPQLIHFLIAVNAEVSSLTLQLFIRLVLATAVFLPASILLGAFLVEKTNIPTESHVANQFWKQATISLGTGWILFSWLPRWEVSLAVVSVGTLWIFAGILIIRATKQVENRRMLRIIQTTGLAVLLLAPLVSSRANPAESSRLLFSSKIFQAYRNGLNFDQFAVLDEGRLVAQAEADAGTLTMWKYHTAQLQLRQSGMPKGIRTENPEVFPRHGGNVLPVLIPLTFHHQPERVMLLGLNSGGALQNSLAFPVQHLDCIEPDAGVISFVKNNFWIQENNPLNDARVSLHQVDPLLAVRSSSLPYDVMISLPDHPTLLPSSTCYTDGFYREAAHKLTADGIFCQVFPFRELGATPLKGVIASLQSAFREVNAIEASSGEFLFLATNSELGLARAGTVERLELPQVRRMCGELGCDWATVLNLATITHENLAAFAEQHSANTSTNALLAWQNPREVLRWSPKVQEVQQSLASSITRFAERVATTENEQGLKHRIQELQKQIELQTTYPDRPWVYRKYVKDRLTQAPRSQIQYQKDKLAAKVRHPDDDHRIDYFKALGIAFKKQSRITPEDVKQVERFLEPYDPLLTYWQHDEIAKLYARCKTPDVSAEFRHRLHTVFFAHPQDRSVRNVAEALQLLVENPETVADDLDRWDHLNALLEMLKYRWQIRGMQDVSGTVPILLNDIEKSLSALESGLNQLETLGETVAVPAGHAAARRAFLVSKLERPLRGYRTNLRAFQQRNQHRPIEPNPNEKSDTESFLKALEPVAN